VNSAHNEEGNAEENDIPAHALEAFFLPPGIF